MAWVSQQVLASLAVAAPGGFGRRLGWIEIASGVRGRPLENALLKLRRRGWVAYEKSYYSVTAAGRAFIDSGKRVTSGPRGPETGRRLYAGTLRERVWRAIRIRRKFSVLEIIPLVVKGAEKDAESNVGKYLRALTRSGFLAALPSRERGTAPTSNGFKRYLLVRDSGPQAPRWRAGRSTVYDPNTEEEHRL